MFTRKFIQNLLVALVQKKFGILPEFLVEVPESSANGDYFSNAALVLGKSLKKVSIDVAKEIADVLSLQWAGWKVEVVGPGFINLWMSNNYLQDEFRKIPGKH